MLHLENFFEKSFALLLTTPNCLDNIEFVLTKLIVLCYNPYWLDYSLQVYSTTKRELGIHF